MIAKKQPSKETGGTNTDVTTNPGKGTSTGGASSAGGSQSSLPQTGSVENPFLIGLGTLLTGLSGLFIWRRNK